MRFAVTNASPLLIADRSEFRLCTFLAILRSALVQLLLDSCIFLDLSFEPLLFLCPTAQQKISIARMQSCVNPWAPLLRLQVVTRLAC